MDYEKKAPKLRNVWKDEDRKRFLICFLIFKEAFLENKLTNEIY